MRCSALGEKGTGKISIFRNQCDELNSGISSHLEKHLKFFMVTSAPHDQQKPSGKIYVFLQKVVVT